MDSKPSGDPDTISSIEDTQGNGMTGANRSYSRPNCTLLYYAGLRSVLIDLDDKN